MSAYRPTPQEVAILVVLMIKRYCHERGRDTSRIRLARTSLRRLAIRGNLRDVFIDDWIDVMATDYGWIVFRQEGEFLLLKSDATKTWTKIATKRCDDLIRRLRAGDHSAIEDAETEIDRAADDSEDDEDNDSV